MGPRLGAQQHAIIKFLAAHCERDYTRNELAEMLGIRISSACGRVKELLDMGVIEESPRRCDRYTGIASHPVKLRSLQAELFA